MKLPEPVLRPRLYEQVAQQIAQWIEESGLEKGERLPAEREFAQQLGVSRATLTQALVALEVLGVVQVRHGDGTLAMMGSGSRKIVESIREHTDRLPDILDAREALETKLAALAAKRRTDEDMKLIDEALRVMEADIVAGGRGLTGDEQFHSAVTQAAHSPLLSRMITEISSLILETRIESLSQRGRPLESLKGHRLIAEAIRDQSETLAQTAMQEHIKKVSNLPI